MKYAIVACCLLLTLSLSACGTTQNPASQSQATAGVTPQTETTPQGDRNPTAEELGRTATTTLGLSLEGDKEDVPATLYIGQGYSLYIPDEGWELERDAEDLEESWQAVANHEVELSVRHFRGKTAEQTRTAILADHDDYGFMDMDADGHFSGNDGKDAETMDVRLYENGDGTWAVMAEYPDEAAEGYGVRLRAMAETFALME